MIAVSLFSEYGSEYEEAKSISCAVLELYGDCHLSSKPLAPCNPQVAAPAILLEYGNQTKEGMVLM